MNAIEGYVSQTSVVQEEAIDFHLAAEPAHSSLQIQVYRLGINESLVFSDTATAGAFPTPENAYEIGCSWPSAYTLTIPKTWKSGVYRARFMNELDSEISTEILFVVKAVVPGSAARILFQLAVNTYQAYNGWGGKSLYDYNSTSRTKANRISFDRPDRYDDFYLWEYPLIQWMEAKGFVADYCTNIDIHIDGDRLSHYQLLLSVGHDEYWSWEMRDHVEAFIQQGGNAAFLGGNLCWWQVRFEDHHRTMVCYKKADADPMSRVDSSRVTVNWKDTLINRPENQMTGVSFAQGAGWFNSEAGPRPKVGYRVRFSQHWVFANTDLEDDAVFGAENSIIGYETDAAVFLERNGIPQATGKDGTPLNFIVLATANLSDWGKGGQAGMATMGIYQNQGTVFTAATVDWTRGLLGNVAVSQITENILLELSQRRSLFPEIQNANFEIWIDQTHPQNWLAEGLGQVQKESPGQGNPRTSLRVDATMGQTWLTQGSFACETGQFYRVSGWVRCGQSGATIRLQSTNTWQDFVIAEHPGNGQWEYVVAIAQPQNKAFRFAARVKIEVAQGTVANFGQIHVERL